MRPVLLVDVVGLTSRLIGSRTHHLKELAERGACSPMSTVLPAVTCSAQATMLTGASPRDHGVVGNGWFFRDLGEVFLWRQSNELVRGEKLYEAARRRDPAFRCAKIFWWWNMGAAVDLSVTPRPYYPADGRKIPAVYSRPTDFGADLERELGPFPFFDFWGPRSGLPSSRWLARAAIRTMRSASPHLTMVYLPHLDYSHQRFGPSDQRSLEAVEEVDLLVGELLRAADAAGVETVVVSEYGLADVSRPVHVNRALRRAGLVEVRDTPAGEVLDLFGSRAFAVSDHQVAHVYARDAEARDHAASVLRDLEGVDAVLDEDGKRDFRIDHERAGDLVAVADRDAWFTYYYWLDDARAPDFARTVDIHRKPGYDPCELFVDPQLALPAARVGLRLAQKALGLRYLMDLIPLDASLVRGSHGRLPEDPLDGPVFLCSRPFGEGGGESGGECGPEPQNGVLPMESVRDRVLRLIFD